MLGFGNVVEAREARLFRFEIPFSPFFVRREPDRNPVRRQQTHQPKSANSAACIAAQIDDQAFDVPKFLHRCTHSVCNIDADHAGEHSHFEIACIGRELSCLDQRRFDELQLFTLRLSDDHRYGSLYAVIRNKSERGRGSHRKYRMLRGNNVFPVHAKQDVSRLDPCRVSRTALMNVLKHPAGSVFRLAGEVGRA